MLANRSPSPPGRAAPWPSRLAARSGWPGPGGHLSRPAGERVVELQFAASQENRAAACLIIE